MAKRYYFRPPQVYLRMGAENHKLCCVFFIQILPNLPSLLHFLFNVMVLRKRAAICPSTI